MSTDKWAALLLASLVSACGKGGSPTEPNGPTELRLSLKNVNVIPGMWVELLTAAGARKAYRMQGGSESTDPIKLSLARADAQVTVMMDRNEEFRVRPKRGGTEGAQKACRRKGNGSGASAEVHVAEVSDVRCVGEEWDTRSRRPNPIV